MTGFSVSSDGTAEPLPDSDAPEPAAEDRRRARLLAEGGNFAPDTEDLFARGIAVARAGGDVSSFLRDQLATHRRRKEPQQ